MGPSRPSTTSCLSILALSSSSPDRILSFLASSWASTDFRLSLLASSLSSLAHIHFFSELGSSTREFINLDMSRILPPPVFVITRRSSTRHLQANHNAQVCAQHVRSLHQLA
ncbi:uncharacterized protein ASPGLDRAFT_1227236 [Aspergillus glaucus CBS 516.65]|uniref:Uncharacterized protein n=1 Tax=Aspergillus glaucus CBS 516.65 TaxID=1160497 RepID=A0A1L9VR93_ASPGL|nr:hypothetical protein ASPGLDRAFT_1227236 [Aspergillus glaucus CBS 516.65]OJJ86429.1 hypothetical protein ASPGLDRAFT_1227236 [Aspergillus glaucus CBS 516.65]